MADSDQTDVQLLRLYNEVDACLRRLYSKDKYAEHSFLIQEVAAFNRVVARYQQEMRAVAQLRNSLVHSPFLTDGPMALPDAAVVKRYKAIRDALLNPLTALSIAIPANKIYTVSMKSNLNEVLQAMDKHIYTHVPVMEGQKMVGILSENTLLSYLAEAGECIFTKEMVVGDLKPYLALNSHRSEQFVFLARHASLGQVYEVFNEATRQHRRIGMVFITEHGKENEKALGIITAWDLASPEFEL